MTDIEQWFRDNAITEVECLVPDMTGIPRGKIMPARKYISGGKPRLPETIFVQTVTGDYPDDCYDHINPSEVDMLLVADTSSVRLVPWANEPTAQLIHDCVYVDGDPVSIAPRHVLRRILDTYEQRGWQAVVAPELEFYLVNRNTDPDYPLEAPVGRSGRRETGRRSYSIDAVNEFDPLFEEMYEFCEAQNLTIETLVHEDGAAQVEINFLHGDPLKLADEVFLFKRTMREVALRHGIYATFMAKPIASEPGSSMHVHQSVVDRETGRNMFVGDDGKPNKQCLSYMGGLQKYLPLAMPLLAPNVNSYRRLRPDMAAPINTEWGYDNRTVGLRVPIDEPDATRIENRLAGADANPYLAIAATLACGYLGMMERLDPTPPLYGSGYDRPHSLPTDLSQALQPFTECRELRDLLGDRFVDTFAALKRSEYVAYFRIISSWEREHLLMSV